MKWMKWKWMHLTHLCCHLATATITPMNETKDSSVLPCPLTIRTIRTIIEICADGFSIGLCLFYAKVFSCAHCLSSVSFGDQISIKWACVAVVTRPVERRQCSVCDCLSPLPGRAPLGPLLKHLFQDGYAMLSSDCFAQFLAKSTLSAALLKRLKRIVCHLWRHVN